jgi:sigma-E factor negative regulatory protein RseA
MARIEAIDHEISVPPEIHSVSKRRHWLHWSAGGAIAASVAVAALMLAQPAGHEMDGTTHDIAASTNATVSDTAIAHIPANAPTVPQWLNANSAAQFTQKAAFGASDDAASYLPQTTPYQLQRGQSHRMRSSATSGRYMLMVRPDGYVQTVPAAGTETR